MDSHERKLLHLLRRTGFAVSPNQLAEFAKTPIPDVVDSLLERAKSPTTLAVPELPTDPKQTGDAGRTLQLWWIETMRQTSCPLLEKMTLFWHNHFTSGFDKVKPEFMLKQNELLRKHALGKLRDLLIEISIDPAMMHYLDNTYNNKKAPNENYARELMELFTLGIGHYTEKDIKEVARSLTGWRYDSKTQKVSFDEKQHDSGEKTIFGKTGNYGLSDVVDLILGQPQCAHFIVTKLWKAFGYPQPDPAEIESLEKVFIDGDYDIKSLLKTLFTSDAFYSDSAYRAIVKSPTDYVVELLTIFRKLKADQSLLNAMHMMGQSLFAPPNVAGWPGGVTWLDSSKLLARINWVDKMTEAVTIQDLPKLGKNAEEDVNLVLQHLAITDISTESYTILLSYAQQTQDISVRLKGLLYLAFASPEAQLM